MEEGHSPSQAPLVWFTGLSGAGKSTLARAVFEALQAEHVKTELLDADQVRRWLAGGLGYSPADRAENVRRLGFVAGLLTRHGIVTLVAAMSPYRAGRDAVRAGEQAFLEVFVDAPLASANSATRLACTGVFTEENFTA